MSPTPFPADAVRDDFIPREDYIDQRFADLEAERLWPRVWQIGCRLEEIPAVGDFVTYDILDQSIIIVRSAPGLIQAFHNSCPHRGNLLTEGCGNTKQFVCSFHGWRFKLNGHCLKVVDRKDWGELLSDDDTALSPVSVGTWGGWVWINMDPGCQPLDEFLEPMKSRCERYEFDRLRFAWYRSTVVEANWKTVVEAFTEFYHVQTTHEQMLSFTNDYSISRGMGRHGWMSYHGGPGMAIGRSPRLPTKEVEDQRTLILDYAEQFKSDLNALQPERAYQAAQRLISEVSPGADREEVIGKWMGFVMEAAEQEGTGWPSGLTAEYMAESGFDWHVFPNTVFLHTPEAVLWYRMRPLGKGGESCLFDIWSLERFAPGKEPPLKREFYADWREAEWPLIYRQDLENIPKVQRGMHSKGFKGSRTSPIQERAIANFHRVLRRFLEDPHADDDAAPEPCPASVPGAT